MDDQIELENGDQYKFSIQIPRLNQQFDANIEKQLTLGEFFEAIAELVSTDVKSVRLMYNGQRISNDSNKRVGDEFQSCDSSKIEIIVFTESQGASS
ncbi:hypothetical protein TTHERM_00578890 (macronuclear) [Tetrahymena thermophila SB210]|uniref:Ubiquitin-like domain-containing protein n=1 Tax=Tetrahymena thermophila (strain SB210) TaxID=312017 RepID=I7MLL4_TETTS|nr:hypothetical protein TTHERM_00578890 [Tetrahymena thermophila SB210]EAS02645.1 hypothetical protein TTHERM_00578890 [Tetrahymena thermophila SB210]|eukprot:XP_001022890.1 hypothetical protein TTHERM_00578890 [Tetrahymena thermophila SB210]